MSFISLLPFFVIFSFTLLFQKIIIAMMAGILSVIAIKWLVYGSNFIGIMTECFQTVLSIITQRDYILPIAFFTMVTFIVDLLCFSGIMAHYKAWMRTKISSSQGLEKATLLLAPLFFIDDYLSSLSLGAFIRPLLSCYRVARAKFAYLLNSSSSSLCVLLPLSSWSIMIMGQIKNVIDLNDFMTTNEISPTHIMLCSTPFLLYPACVYFFAWIVVVGKFSFGPMKIYENHMRKEGSELQGNSCIKSKEPPETNEHNKKWVFFVPFLVFFSVLIGQLIRTARSLPSEHLQILEVVEKTDLASSMVYGVLLGFIILCGVMKHLKILSWKMLQQSIQATFLSTHTTLSVLILAWIVGTLLKSIGALTMFASLCSFIPGFNWYPLIFFLLSFFTCIAMGSSWGTIALLMPLLSGLQTCNPLFMYLAVACLVAGALAGTHFTPISDAMVMASSSAGCDIIVHYKTHMAYAFIPLVGSLSGLIFASLFLSTFSYLSLAIFSLSIALLITALLGYIRIRYEKIFS